jgi:hypothetical protein
MKDNTHGTLMISLKLETDVPTSIAIFATDKGRVRAMIGAKELRDLRRMTNTTTMRKSQGESAQHPKQIPTGRIRIISVMDGDGARETEYAGELPGDSIPLIISITPNFLEEHHRWSRRCQPIFVSFFIKQRFWLFFGKL